jgi:required for meiotic nuclear division protein 1
VSSVFTAHGLSLFDSIPIKQARDILSGKLITITPRQLALKYGEDAYLFVFQFGSVVFVNVPEAVVREELDKLRGKIENVLPLTSTETYVIHSGSQTNHVDFEYVELKKATVDHMRLVARSVGQSAALETFEIRAERMLSDAYSLINNLATRGRLPLWSKGLLKTIGTITATRQNIISNLAVLDSPDEVWDSKELEKLYRELQQNFDIDTRFRSLDRKLTLLQDNLEILADLATSRKTNFLETLIVLLIVLEIALAVFGLNR